MTSKVCLLFKLLPIFLSGIVTNSQEVVDSHEEVSAKAPKTIIFRNELTTPVEIYWEGDTERIVQHPEPLPPGGEIQVKSYPGHKFSYDVSGERHFEDVMEDHPPVLTRVLLGGRQEIAVRCTTTTSGTQEIEQELNIRVIPWWSPNGASRFLQLVRMGYYNGVALNRVVPGFLTQFGIGADFAQRTKYRQEAFRDDIVNNIPFSPGVMSFAGSGPDSRTTEVFIVMPNTSQAQLDYFGENPWETPFAYIENVETTPVATFHAYGDMPPNGSGPLPSEIYGENGYEYLSKDFPEMDYIEECQVIEVDIGTTEEL